jgi:hypothetical protein
MMRFLSRRLSATVIGGGPHLQARLHAQLAAFAAEVNWNRLQLPRGAGLPSHDEFVCKLAADMGLNTSICSGELRVTKRPGKRLLYREGNRAIIDACKLFGPRPLALLLSQPLLDEEDPHKNAVAGARNVSLLVRACAAEGHIGAMLDALDEGTTSSGLLANQSSHNAALSAAMGALSKRRRAEDAMELYDASLQVGLQPDSHTLMQLCTAARKQGRASAEHAVELVIAAVDAGSHLNAAAIDAYVDCCAMAGAAPAAIDAFALGLLQEPPPSGRWSSDHGRHEAENLLARRHVRRLSAVYTACARSSTEVREYTRTAQELAAKHGLKPDIPCSNALMRALGQSRDIQGAVRIFHALLRRLGPPKKLQMDLHARLKPTNAARTVYWLPPMKELRRIEAEVAESKPAATPAELRSSLHCALAACKTNGHSTIAFRTLQLAAAAGVVPDVIGLTSAIGACRFYGGNLRSGRPNADEIRRRLSTQALTLFRWGVVELGVEPDVVCIRELRSVLSSDETALSDVDDLIAAAKYDVALSAPRSFGASSWLREHTASNAVDAGDAGDAGDDSEGACGRSAAEERTSVLAPWGDQATDSRAGDSERLVRLAGMLKLLGPYLRIIAPLLEGVNKPETTRAASPSATGTASGSADARGGLGLGAAERLETPDWKRQTDGPTSPAARGRVPSMLSHLGRMLYWRKPE